MIFWGVDSDVFAAEVGRYIQNTSSENAKSVRYDGVMSSDGLYTYLEKHPELKFSSGNHIKDSLGSVKYWNLRSVDAKNWHENTSPWQKKIISDCKAKFSIELHSTSLNNFGNIHITCHTNRFNKKCIDLLRKYVASSKSIYPSECDLGVGIYGDRTYGPYHQIAIEFWHDSDEWNKITNVEVSANLIKNISNYFAENYHKLWKKRYMKD